MKKLGLLCLMALFTVLTLQAQDAKTLWKEAKKAHNKYNLDPTNNADAIVEAMKKIDGAIKSDDYKSSFEAWRMRGEIYSDLAKSSKAGDYLDAASVSYDSFDKASGMAEKKYQKREVSAGLTNVATLLINSGVKAYEAKNFEAAFNSFDKVFNAKEKLSAMGKNTILTEEAQLDEHIYRTGFMAQKIGKNARATELLSQLYKKDYKEAGVYELLFNLYSGDNKEKMAMEVMEKGRKLFPKNLPLLYAEINHYLRSGKFVQLEDKLKGAIDQDPDNKSLYLTLGNVYDKLYQTALEEKNEANADKNMKLAENYYSQALEKDPEYFDAIYSLGALFYNKAAEKSKQMVPLANDLSKAGTAKYNNLRGEMNALFDQALPYFNKAEKMNPNDRNTLIALKEIYAKKDDLVKSAEYKKRFEALGNK